jgi:hypothetical protein
MQFLGPRAVFQASLPLPATLGLSPEEDQVLDKRVDDLGYLHLSTPEPYVYHMGNQVDEIALAAKIETSAVLTPQPAAASITGWPLGWRIVASLARSPLLRGFFTRLYNRLFQIYSQ